jgi:hypothetical protein
VALRVYVSAVRAGARGTHEERATRGIRRIPLCRARGLEALLMAEAAYADLETPGQVLTDRNTPRCASELGKEAIGRHRR